MNKQNFEFMLASFAFATIIATMGLLVFAIIRGVCL